MYQVEEILEKRIHKGKIQYRVKWVDYPISESTWEPVSNLTHVKSMITEFENNQEGTPEKKVMSAPKGKRKSKPEEEKGVEGDVDSGVKGQFAYE